jgi:hypothetical protein
VTTSSPIVLASGAITPDDSPRVELHQPIGSPAFILVRWPEAPSITSTEPKALARMARSVVGILATAQARLAKVRSKQL